MDDRAADVARRRLAALSAELAAARGEPVDPVETAAPTSPEPAPLPRVEPPRAEPHEVPEPPEVGRHARRPLGAGDRLVGWLGDRLPVTLRARPHLGAAQMGVVLVVLALGLLGGAWWLVRSSGAGGEVVAPPVVASTGTPTASAPPTPSAAPSPGAAETPVAAGGEGQLVVDVVGKVRRPGIAVLPAGSRVVDAVRAAGGLRRGVDRTSLNLARLLTDGEQVLIGVAGGTPPPTGTGTTGSAPPGTTTGGTTLVNLNTADQATLETLPGVGPVTAAAILQWRTEHGGFTAVEELLEVSGIGEATLAELTPFVTL